MFDPQVADGLTEPSNAELGIAIPSEVPDWMVEAVESDPVLDPALDLVVEAIALGWVTTEASAEADRCAAAAAAMPPGAESARLIEQVSTRALSERGRVDFALACERLAAWASARQLPAVVDHIGRDVEPDRSGNERRFLDQACWFTELQVSLNLSETALASRLAMARALTGRLSDTYSAFLAGELSYMHVRAIVETLDEMGDDHAAVAQERILARASGKTISELRRLARNTVDRIDAEAAARRHARASTERSVERWSEPDGVAALTVRGPAPDVEAIWAALTVLAGPRESDDPRRIGARRFDAILGLCLGAVAPRDQAQASAQATSPSTPVQAQIVIDLATLLELADNPCELRGYGTVPAGVARGWLQQADTWRRLVTDPVQGHLLDFGPVARFAPPKLRRFIAVRDQTCTFPQCRQPARRCDLDHDPPWRPDDEGGTTSAEQMAALCRRHHRFKTHGGWSIEYRADGDTVWRSPTGRRFTTLAPPVLIDP